MADKTFSEMMHEKLAVEREKRAQEREQQRNEFLNGFRSELEGYQQKALETAKTRELGNLRTLYFSGSLDEAKKAEVQEKILNPSLITATATDADYGTNLPRVKELLDFIANPEKAQKKIDQESFIARMKGFAERNAKN
nr:MAG TPA: hypothetical protein [Caudoviricetes sp.]